MSLGIYIHIPFCIKKCAYCDFLSFPAEDKVRSEYVKALVSQIEKSKGGTIDSIFIGGGTPSVLSGEDILKIMEAVRKKFEFDKNCEITIEINPATVTEEKLISYKKAGINRISMGVQSFSDDELKSLGRLHSASCAEESFRLLRKCGFSNINLDLMFAIPNQSIESFEKSLKRAVMLSPEHISAYSLIIEEGTPFYEMEECGQIQEADEELYEKMFELAKEILEKNGYMRYEISNFSKKGFQSRHNLKYWNGKDYLGFGLGAVGFLKNIRYENTRELKEYLEGKEPEKTTLSKEELISEYIIIGLRKTQGINLDEFKEKFGTDFLKVYDIQKYINGGFMEIKDGRIFFTDAGIKVSNEILCRFV